MDIQLKDYTKEFHKSMVLDHINLELTDGKVYGLYGENGSGKTMLMRAISGLIYPKEGCVLVNGEELGRKENFPEKLGLLLETPYFFSDYTGFQNLKLIASIRNLISDKDICDCINRVGLDSNDKRKFRKYSLGMKQRLGIAAAIMEDPDLLLLDEPFNAIDEKSIKGIEDIILSFRKPGRIVIISCHDMEKLENISDEIIKISGGRLTE